MIKVKDSVKNKEKILMKAEFLNCCSMLCSVTGSELIKKAM